MIIGTSFPLTNFLPILTFHSHSFLIVVKISQTKHIGLTHTFNFLTFARVPECQKINKGGLTFMEGAM